MSKLQIYRGRTTAMKGTSTGVHVVFAGLVNPPTSGVMGELLSLIIGHRPETDVANGAHIHCWITPEAKDGASRSGNLIMPAYAGPISRQAPGRGPACILVVGNTGEGGTITSIATGETPPSSNTTAQYRLMPSARMFASFDGNYGTDPTDGLPVYGPGAVTEREMVQRGFPRQDAPGEDHDDQDEGEGVLFGPGDMIALDATSLSSGEQVWARFAWRERPLRGKGLLR